MAAGGAASPERFGHQSLEAVVAHRHSAGHTGFHGPITRLFRREQDGDGERRVSVSLDIGRVAKRLSFRSVRDRFYPAHALGMDDALARDELAEHAGDPEFASV